MGGFASITDMRNTAPARQVAHRTAVAAADAAPTAASAWASNSGWWPRARAYCTVAWNGGTAPTVTLRVWARKHLFGDEAGVEQYGVLLAPAPAGTPTLAEFVVTPVTGSTAFVFDIPANGDDIFVQVVSVSGAPTGFVFNCAIGWRA